MSPLPPTRPPARLRRRAAWVGALVLSACAHNNTPVVETGPSHLGEPLPRACTADECAIVIGHAAETDSCECSARRLDEALGARIELVFSVPAAGGRPQVYVGRAVSAPQTLQACLIESAATWAFPAPPGGAPTRFHAGIVFTPDGSGPCAPRPDAPLRHARVDKEQTRVALAAHRTDVKTCFEAGGAKLGELAARSVLTLLLNRDGLVIQAQIDESTLPDEKIDRCIVDKAYSWKLPRPVPAGVVTISYPYSFSPGE